MHYRKRNHWFIILLLANLLVSAVMVTPAFADDGVPPVETPMESVANDEISTEDVLPVETPMESVTNNEIPTEDVLPSEEELEEGTPSEPSSVAEVLAQIPDDTVIVVTNEEGEAVPLATEEAAEIVYNGDPIWCPANVAVPTPNKNGCSPSFMRFNGVDGLLAWLIDNDPNKAGIVWIEKTYDSSTANNGMSDGNVVFNGGVLTNMANFALTLRGGWNGLGTGSVSGASSFNGTSLSIVDWKGNITISDIVVTNATTAFPGCSSAVCVSTAGTIKLEWVISSGNDGTLDGAYLDNTASVNNSSSVTVIDSAFNGNAFRGLTINTKGAVTLKNVVANNNVVLGGVYINNTHDLVASPVTITNSTFSNNGNSNGDHGLHVLSNGSITVTNILAVGNWGVGAILDKDMIGPGNVTLGSTNVFNNNRQGGLEVLTPSNVTAKHLIANNNIGNGVSITNLGTVTISGSGQFNNNSIMGMRISSSGAVALNNLTATSNNGDGVSILNYHGNNVAAPVKIKGINDFSGNQGFGLHVHSDGAITISKVTANNNQLGVWLQNHTPDKGPQNVTVLGYLNAIDNKISTGVTIQTQGVINIANLNASRNLHEGAILDNSFAVTPKNVILTGVNTFTYNQRGGLVIHSRGAVTLSNITAIGNGRVPDGNGGYLGGEYIGLFINNAYDPAVQKNVTLKGNNVFNGNGLHGTQIQSYGAILLTNVTASRNGFYNPADFFGNGVYLLNQGGLLVKSVTLSGVNLFDNNNENGLSIFSDGAITVSKPTAVYNGMSGVFLNNMNGKAPSKVTIIGYGLFDSNLAEGLFVLSNGAITTNNLTANYNGNAGVDLRNFGLTGPQAVKLNGTNSFIHNGFIACSRPLCASSGLYVASDGNITVSNLTANNNYWGVFLDNSVTPFVKVGSIIINGYGNISGNFSTGLFVRSLGNATLTRISANDNGATLFDDGITLQVDGNVKLTCSSAYNNFGMDIRVTDSTFNLPAKSITLSNSFIYGKRAINALLTTYKPCP